MILKLGMQHLELKLYKACTNDDPGLTLTYFTERSRPKGLIVTSGLILVQIICMSDQQMTLAGNRVKKCQEVAQSDILLV